MVITTCVLYISSLLKIKIVVHSAIAAQTLSLVDGCDVTIYINNLLSEPLHIKHNCLSITTYTDNQSFYEAVHSMKKTLEKRLLVDISATREMVEKMRSKSHGLTKKNN